MDTPLIFNIFLLIIGIAINIFIGKLVIIIFKKDGRLQRTPLRVLGIYLIIHSVSEIFHI